MWKKTKGGEVHSSSFLKLTLKNQAIKAKIDKWDCIKIKA
jgi:hypothetical protein